MRIVAYVLMVFTLSRSPAYTQQAIQREPTDAMKLSTEAKAATAYAKEIAPKGSAEYTLAFRKALALSQGAVVNDSLGTFGGSWLVKSGAIDQDVRFRQNLGLIIDRDRVWGAIPAKPGEYPDTVAITGAGGICTGTIIADDTVLTAAHCVCAGVSEQIYIGESVMNAREIIPISKSTPMTPCNSDMKSGDVAILTLSRKTTVAPRSLSSSASILAASSGIVAGYGMTENPIVQPMGIKRWTHVPMASPSCSGTVQTLAGPESDEMFYKCSQGSEIVAGAPSYGKDTCNGDSGGPMFIETSSGDLTLAATTSRATGAPGLRQCGDGGIYVRTDGKVLTWLRSLGVRVSVAAS